MGKNEKVGRLPLKLDEKGNIPKVARDLPSKGKATRPLTPSSPLLSPLVLGGLGLGLLLLILTALFSVLWRPQTQPEVVVAPTPIASSSPVIENVLGHLAYPEAPAKELKAINSRWQLRVPAAKNFLQMQAAARAAGINLVVISAFRSVKDQERIFFDVKQARNQAASKRAEVSAPPGYSEHHTGYAIDIGDGNNPKTNLSQSFENTAAYRWLKNNAARYDFEMSFTPGNAQGVSYEPWHWRFVGDRASLETFYRARNLQPN